MGISTNEGTKSSTNNSVQQKFNDSVKFVGGRYEVALPWKSDFVKYDLQNNVKIAEKRLFHLCRKFQKNPQLKEEYDGVLRQYEEEGICEEVPPSQMESVHPTFYLPHRPVIRESSSSTRVRPVFDASAPSYNGLCLNECLETGPSLNPDLVEVLLRFRKWQVAITADITKAFLQINVREEDRDVHRFLWMFNDVVRTMRFIRVPFGNKSSPFLLNATIKHHLNNCKESEVVQELRSNLYVDDWLSGADTVEEGKAKFTEACSVLAGAGMTLTKWTSNSKNLRECFGNESDLGERESIKVLGMQWEVSNDCFMYDVLHLTTVSDITPTKRAVLSCIARLFDPIGLISPYIMSVKILFQDVWRVGSEWDEVLPSDLLHKFHVWLSDVDKFKSWHVQRCYFLGTPFKFLTGMELHVFGDASEKGYGACAYLRVVDSSGTYRVSFVMSRGRVAPIKSISLPRLELLAGVMCARLVNFVKTALRLEVPIFCWTDSTVTLNWIKGDCHRWKTFVRNRVSEIQELTCPSNWHHCPGKSNPADLISRGVSAEQLMSCDQWLSGPAWLSRPLNQREQQSPCNEDCQEEEVTACFIVGESQPVFEFSQWSEFCKTVNIVAWVMRFINNGKRGDNKSKGPLSYDELSKAKIRVFIGVQRDHYFKEYEALRQGKSLPLSSTLRKLDPLLDEDGLMRVKGRLDHAELSYESKHPIIIPNCHVAKLLVRFQHQLLKHAGVQTLVSTLRNCYWIVGLRRMAKSICKMCVVCRRHDSKACKQPVAPLPESRVKPSPPFSVTGLDFAGPLFCVDMPSTKFYVLLFTCAVIRAIHIELTDSLSMKDCMLAIRRFVSRRGLPSIIYSDNAKTFVATSQALSRVYGPVAPNWKFILARAPWWGGWWERMIRSVKLSLRKSIGVKCLSRNELETTLHEIEACINSRPLTFVGEELNEHPLSPSHFLIGRTAGFQVEGDKNSLPCSLKIREQLRTQQLEKFWKIWSDHYIKNLPPTVKGFTQNCKIRKGSLVLIREDNIPRMSWPIARVLEVYPGKDNIVRSVKVKTSRGVILRPIQKLHDLEVQDNDCNVDLKDVASHYVEDNVQGDEICSDIYTRAGRRVKAPERYGL